MRQTGLVAVFCEFTYRYFLRDVQCATALAYKGLVLLAALGLLCLWFAAVAGGGDGEALPHAPPKGFYPFGIPTLAGKLGLFTYGNHAHFMVG